MILPSPIDQVPPSSKTQPIRVASAGLLVVLLLAVFPANGCFSWRLQAEDFRPKHTQLTGDQIELPVDFAGIFPVVEVMLNGTGPTGC